MIVIYVFAVYVVSVCSSDLCKNFDPLPFKFAHFSNKLTYDVFSTDEPSKCNLNEFKEVKDLTKLWVPVNDSSIGGPYYNFAWFVTYLGDNPVAPEGYYGSAFVDEKTGLIHVFYLKGGDSGEVDADYEIWRVFYAADSVHAIYVCDSLVEENATPQFVYVTNTKKTLDSDTLAAIKSRMGDLGLDSTLKVIDQSDCSETLDYALKCPAPDSPADICFDDYEHTHGGNQRELARIKNLKKNEGKKKSTEVAANAGLTVEQIKQRDADRMREKQKAAAEKKQATSK